MVIGMNMAKYACYFGSAALILAGIAAGTAVCEVPGQERGRDVENLINVSFGDQIMIARGDAQLDTPEKVQRSIKSWQEDNDGQTILWRMSSIYMKRFYERRQSGGFAIEYLNKVAEIEKLFDPPVLARQQATANGQQFLLYLTVFDHGAPLTDLYGGDTPFPFQDRYTIEHPEVQAVDREGNYHNGVLDMAHPQARKLMVDRIAAFVEELDADGAYICTRTHSLPALHADQFGFGKPIVQAYQKRYGINILEDPRFDYKDPGFNSRDPAVEKWRRLRGEYLVQFYRELRDALPGKVLYTGIPRGRYIGPPYGNMYLDWESLANEKLVDGIVLGVYSGKQLHPPLYVPHDKIGYLSSEDDDINIPTVEDAIQIVYGPTCRENGVKLFYYSAAYGSLEKRRLQDMPGLNGFMLVTPASVPGRGVITFEEPLTPTNDQITVDAYIYVNNLPEGHQGTPRILSKYSHFEGDRHRGWEWILTPTGHIQFRVNQASQAKGMGGDVTLDSSSRLPIREWVHVATVYDAPNGELRLYIDGKVSATRRIANLPMRPTPGQDLYLGRYGGQDSHQFDGMIDELRITGEALTFSTKPSHPYTGHEPNTIGLYHFDQVGPTFVVTNSSDPVRLPLKVVGGGDSLLVDSLPAYNRAFDMSTNDE